MSDAIDFKELVRARTNIVEVIGESIGLSPRRGGAEFVGLCPFHDDHNPSLQVSPDRQSFKCWVCDTGGDVFSFVMKHEGVTFAEAVDLLGERAGLERPKRSRPAAGGGVDKPRLYDVLAWADRQFRTFLKAGSDAKEARDYIASRGISPAMVERFGLGFAPRDWQWLLGRARGTYTAKDLLQAGVAKERTEGNGLVDRFVDRVMFPICDERSRVVSFGGRIMPGRGDQAGPKYLNGNETPVFPKSKLVYALDRARDAIRDTKTAVVMEGYTDVIAAHQAGHANVVATLGTALGESHVSLLKRFAKTVVLVYDGDDAGLNAAERALVRFLAQDVDLRILALPEGLDPADYLAKDSGGGFSDLLAKAPTALEFKLDASVRRFGLETDLGSSRVVADVLAAVAAAPGLAGSTREDAILQKVSSRTGLREQRIRDELKRLRGEKAAQARPQDRSSPQKSSPPSGPRPDTPPRPDDPAEREVLSVILTRPDLFEPLARTVGPDDFTSPRLRAAFEHCRDVADLHGTPAYDLLMSSTDDPGLKQVLVGLDADARRRGLPDLLGGPGSEPDSGTQTASTVAAGMTGAGEVPRLFTQVVKKLTDRRNHTLLQRDVGRATRRLAAGPLDESLKDELRRLQRQVAARHAP